MALRNPAVQNHQIPNQIRKDGQSIETLSEMTTVTDPFLGQPNSNDLHARQESADSGVGKGEESFHYTGYHPRIIMSLSVALQKQSGAYTISFVCVYATKVKVVTDGSE